MCYVNYGCCGGCAVIFNDACVMVVNRRDAINRVSTVLPALAAANL